MQKAISLVFAKFLELGTVRQTLLWFVDQSLEVPDYKPGGTGLNWKRPT